MKAIIYGATGGLAQALAVTLLDAGWQVDLVTRRARLDHAAERFSQPLAEKKARVLTVEENYSELPATQLYDAYFLPQSLFAPKPLVEVGDAEFAATLHVGLAEPMKIVRAILKTLGMDGTTRRNICLIGSTSAYAGFKNTALYCAVKHGLLGFVRAMNDEYVATNTRFWLASMGTMHTEMGLKVPGQDPASYLNPAEVAARIIEAVTSPSNLFEPEIIIRRRIIKRLGS